MSHVPRAALAALLATAFVAVPFASAGPFDPVVDLVLDLYADPVSPADDTLDAVLMDLHDEIGEVREVTNAFVLATTAQAFAVAGGQNEFAQRASEDLVEGAVAMTGNAGDAVNDLARLASLGAAQAQAQGDAMTSRASTAVSTTGDATRGLAERRATGLQDTEAAVLQPLPGALMDAFRAIPDPRIPITVIIPEENPQLIGVLDDPTAVPYWDAPDFIDAINAFAEAVPTAPGEVLVVTDAYLAGSVAGLSGEAFAASQDALATGDAVVSAVTA